MTNCFQNDWREVETDRLSAVRRLGVGRLTVVRGHGRSVACQVYASSPLRLLTPRNHGHAAWVYASSYGGGLVDGDTLTIDTVVGREACAFVSTQASTKVYKSPNGTGAELTASVADGGLLVLAPDPVVCFAHSRYHQRQRVELEAEASLVLVDWVSSGRRESGERWAFEEYVSRTIVNLNGRLKVHDGLALRAVDGDLGSRLGDYDVLAVVILLGASLKEEVRRVSARIGEQSADQWPGQLVAGAPVDELGCVCRIAGRSIEQVGQTIRDLLNFVPRRLGDDPWARKW